MTDTIRKFLNILREKLALNEPEDNLLAFEERDFTKRYITIAEIEEQLIYLKKMGVLANYHRYAIAKEANFLPITREDKARRMKWSWKELITGEKAKFRYGIEVVSHDAFYKFYDGSSGKFSEKIDISFDDVKGILCIGSNTIGIDKKSDVTNGHYVLRYIFTNSEGLTVQSFFSDIEDAYFHESLGLMGWRKYYRACEDIQEKIRLGTGGKIQDFLIFKSGRSAYVQINPKYL